MKSYELTGELLIIHPKMTELEQAEADNLKRARREFQSPIRRFAACMQLSEYADEMLLATANRRAAPIAPSEPMQPYMWWSAIARRDALLCLDDLRYMLQGLRSAMKSRYMRSIVDIEAWKAAAKVAEGLLPKSGDVRNANAHYAKHQGDAEQHATNDGLFLSGQVGNVVVETVNRKHVAVDLAQTLGDLIEVDSRMYKVLQAAEAHARKTEEEYLKEKGLIQA